MKTILVYPEWNVRFTTADFHRFMLDKSLHLLMQYRLSIKFYHDVDTMREREVLTERDCLIKTIVDAKRNEDTLLDWTIRNIAASSEFQYASAYELQFGIWFESATILAGSEAFDPDFTGCSSCAEMQIELGTYARNCAFKLVHNPATFNPIMDAIQNHIKADLERVVVSTHIMTFSQKGRAVSHFWN